MVSEFSRDVAHGARTLGQWCPDPPDGRILYLDLETTGLSRSRDRCVMAGLLTLDASGWCLEQAVARAPDEEAAVVEFCDHRMRASDRMVTFNGASFDVPFLRNRAAALGTMAVTEPPHNDLLLYARRQRTQRGLSCSLGALEERMLGLVRVDDPGGAQTGRILRRFLDSPDPRVLAPVLHHNLLDLLSLPPLEELLCPGMISGVPAAGNPRR